MTGSEHYKEAERLLALAESPAGRAMAMDGFDAATLGLGHAMLAQAAAAASPRSREWSEVLR